MIRPDAETDLAERKRTMKTNAQLVSDWIAGYNAHDVEQLLRHTSNEVAVNLAGGMMQFNGIEQWTGHVTQEWATFTDAEMELSVVAEIADSVICRGLWHATMLGDAFMPDGSPVAATGGHTDLPVVFFFTVADGSITTIDGYWNSMIAMNQLGLAG